MREVKIFIISLFSISLGLYLIGCFLAFDPNINNWLLCKGHLIGHKRVPGGIELIYEHDYLLLRILSLIIIIISIVIAHDWGKPKDEK